MVAPASMELHVQELVSEQERQQCFQMLESIM